MHKCSVVAAQFRSHSNLTKHTIHRLNNSTHLDNIKLQNWPNFRPAFRLNRLINHLVRETRLKLPLPTTLCWVRSDLLDFGGNLALQVFSAGTSRNATHRRSATKSPHPSKQIPIPSESAEFEAEARPPCKSKCRSPAKYNKLLFLPAPRNEINVDGFIRKQSSSAPRVAINPSPTGFPPAFRGAYHHPSHPRTSDNSGRPGLLTRNDFHSPTPPPAVPSPHRRPSPRPFIFISSVWNYSLLGQRH